MHPSLAARRPALTRCAVLLAAALLMVLGLPRPAAAFSAAFFPTQSAGNRGSDVTALQYLLNARGQSVGADGVFGSGTKSAVVAFQGANGLTADGIVGPATWGKLVVTVQQPDSGPAVKAVQHLLNAKRGAGLTVDGVFGSGTTAAVKSFQSHAGLGADGIVGPTTWRNLLWHYESVDFGAGTLCDQNPDGNTSANWGTSAAVGQLEAAAAAFAATGNGRLPVGDLSWEHGGDIPGHGSHEAGLDADVWPIRTDSAQCGAGRITWESSTYDRDATRKLVQEIRAKAPGHIKVIWFNDPVLINEGLVKPLTNHDNHLHIRYCEAVHPNALYTC
ncbi:penicillin-insensitive murein endopeptidase [Streptomyces coeruleoprunus]|uniref:Penicillin-insensitive murein endopeptidase n=1 Tax=Streptomyces coeruleoprunus TaxID=285563 RepID=A0ABV9XDY6_9ACTN